LVTVEMSVKTTKARKSSSKGIKSLLGGFLGLFLKQQRSASIILNLCKMPICGFGEDLAKF